MTDVSAPERFYPGAPCCGRAGRMASAAECGAVQPARAGAGSAKREDRLVQFAQKLAESVGTGVTDIFRDCLEASGLDDARYELNSALSQVLNIPQAADRWSRGERVLNASATTTDA